jgi:microcystin-dependent protein
MAVGRITPNSGVPVNAALCEDVAATLMYTSLTTPIVQMNQNAIVVQGGSLPHNNMMPYLTLNFCIALQGVYPARP